MLVALILLGDRLDHWTFQRPGKPQPRVNPNEVRIYGMTLAQIRKLHVFYVSRTGDTKLERL